MGLHPEYIKKFYEKHVANGKVYGEELRALCPGHDDSNSSFSVNLSTGLYNCFAPNCPIGKGNIYQFLSFIEQIPLQEAAGFIDQENDEQYPSIKSNKKTKVKATFPYTQEDVDNNMNSLLANPNALKFLKENCLWTEDTIKKFNIGYSMQESCYWVPVKINLQLVNIRKYKPASKMKWFSVTDFGEARIFPIQNMSEDTIYIMEGEKDCILANQLGLNAVAPTCGCGTFKTEWKKEFTDKNVVICYDIDAAGREGAHKVNTVLVHVARSIKIVDLPDTLPENGDFTDYMLSGNTIQDFHDLVYRTPITVPETDSPVDIPDTVHEVPLDSIDESLLFYKRTKSKVRVIGADSSPYITARTMEVSCNQDAPKNLCSACRLGDKGGKDKINIDETTPRVLDMIECKSADRMGIIRDIFHIPLCRRFKVKEKDHQPIHRVSVIPAIDEISTNNQSYVERELYFIGERLESNSDYEVESLAVPSPKDQSLVHLGYKVNPADSSIEEFKMTVELKEKLGIFQCESEKS